MSAKTENTSTDDHPCCRGLIACVLAVALACLVFLPGYALAASSGENGTAPKATKISESGISTLSKRDMEEVSEEEEGISYVAGELCVLFDQDATTEEAEQELEEIGLSLGDDLEKSLDEGKAYAPRIEDGDSVAETLDEIRGNSSDAIAYAQPNYIYESDDMAESERSLHEESISIASETAWSNEDPSKESWQLDAVNAQEAWGITKTEGAVTVAVIDSGVDVDHEDLKDRIVAGYDSVEDDYDYDDGNGHGTHVAGIVAATADNDLGVQGVSYNANLIAIDAAYSNAGSGWYETTDLANAYRWLLINNFVEKYNLHVINMSIYGKGNACMDDTLSGYINEAYDKGILTVCAAGNENSTGTFTPADHEKCMSVINLQQDPDSPDGLSRYPGSNYGLTRDIAAPGTDIYSTLPNDDYDYMTGTSMASPVVAGVAALVFAADDTLGPGDVWKILTESALDLGEPGFDEETAWGCVDAYAAVRLATCYAEKHVYDEGTVISEQTCTQDGVTVYTCKVCGNTVTREVSAAGHIWDIYEYTDLYEGSESGGGLSILGARFTSDIERYNLYDTYVMSFSGRLPVAARVQYTAYKDGHIEYLYLYDRDTLVMTVYVEDETIEYINPAYGLTRVRGGIQDRDLEASTRCLTCGERYDAEYADLTLLYQGDASGYVSILGARFTTDLERRNLYDAYLIRTTEYGNFYATVRYTAYSYGQIEYLYLYDGNTLVMTVYVEDETITYINPDYGLAEVYGVMS
ncbi:MAG: S8 family serine peptidase [Bacteroidales bacterium]|nr:S8 family serine peptidase [Bacteroidales bacterium]